MESKSIGLLIIGDEILSSKRQDRHLANLNRLLKTRGLALSWAQILGDEPSLLQATLARSFAQGDIVFSCGGIGATPDDRTRQCAAQALNLPLERHPQAVAEIEAQFGEQAYPQRIRMAEYPKGAAIIPNAFNRVPGFSIQDHHFMPGFPQMSEPMMKWVLDHYYADLCQTPRLEKALRLYDAQESDWVVFMEEFEARFPALRLFSLPHIAADGRRYIELGVEGEPHEVERGYQVLQQQVSAQHNAKWQPITETD